MIVGAIHPLAWLIRLIAPLAWRTPSRIARKLEGFAAAEAGSALDMIKAAELVEDKTLRRLFFRHAMDEARHAELFRECARKLEPDPRERQSHYHVLHATRQNLYRDLGLARFMAFVFLAERRGALHFAELAKYFAANPELQALFTQIGKDEAFHVAYSKRWLEKRRESGHAGEVRRALFFVRTQRAWQTWRRLGRQLGDALSFALFTLVYFVVVPLFARVQRRSERLASGWLRGANAEPTLDSARRQF